MALYTHYFPRSIAKYLYAMLSTQDLAHLISNLFSTKEDPSGSGKDPLLWVILTLCLSWISAVFIDVFLLSSPEINHTPAPEPAHSICRTRAGYRTLVENPYRLVGPEQTASATSTSIKNPTKSGSSRRRRGRI